MSYIITDDKHYKNIANAIRGKLSTDTQYHPEDMSIAINNIPSSADGTDDPVVGIYFTNPDEDGYPTKAKIVGWRLNNKETAFPIVFTDLKFKRLQTIEFLDCDFKSLSNNTFQSCPSLISVNLPNTLTSISNDAFRECRSLTSVNLPDSLTSIGGSAFNGCSSLTSVNFPNTLTSISNDAFRECRRLTSINFPDSLTSIRGSAFYSCSSLTSINFPDSLTSIGNNAFCFCTGLTSVNFPDSLTSIGGGAFLECVGLVDVILANGFNCNNLDLSSSTKFTRETIVSWLIALADRTGLTAYKLIMGATNLAKLTEEDIAIATAKNWTLA